MTVRRCKSGSITSVDIRIGCLTGWSLRPGGHVGFTGDALGALRPGGHVRLAGWSLDPLWSLGPGGHVRRSHRSLRSDLSLDTLDPLGSRFALDTLRPGRHVRRSHRSLGAYFALGSHRAGVAGFSLLTLGTLGADVSLRSGRSDFSLRSGRAYLSLRTLRSNVTGISLLSLFSLRALGTDDVHEELPYPTCLVVDFPASKIQVVVVIISEATRWCSSSRPPYIAVGSRRSGRSCFALGSGRSLDALLSLGPGCTARTGLTLRALWPGRHVCRSHGSHWSLRAGRHVRGSHWSLRAGRHVRGSHRSLGAGRHVRGSRRSG
jgi:hypothetical protein